MEHIAVFPRPRAASVSAALARIEQERVLQAALRKRTPWPVSPPIGIALGISAAHLGYACGIVLPTGAASIVAAALGTICLTAIFLAMLPGRDRWVLGVAGAGAALGLLIAPGLADHVAVDLLRTAWPG